MSKKSAEDGGKSLQCEAVFTNILPKSQWTAHEKEEWSGLLQEVGAEHAPALASAIEGAWTLEWDSTSNHESKDEAELQKEWLRQQGSDLLRAFMVQNCVPEVKVESFQEEEKQEGHVIYVQKLNTDIWSSLENVSEKNGRK